MLARLVGWLWLLGVVVAVSGDVGYNEVWIKIFQIAPCIFDLPQKFSIVSSLTSKFQTSTEDSEVKPDPAASKYHKHHHGGRRRHYR